MFHRTRPYAQRAPEVRASDSAGKDTPHKMVPFLSGLGAGHAVFAFIHAAVFIVLMALRLSDVFPGNKKGEAVIYSDVFILETKTVEYVKIGDPYDVFWVYIWIPLFAAVFHAYQAVKCFLPQFNTYRAHVTEGMNQTHWAALCIINSFLTWTVAQLSGVTNFYILFLISIPAVFALHWQAVFFEEALHAYRMKRESANRFDVAVPMLRGFLILAIVWVFIATAYVRTDASVSGGVSALVATAFYVSLILNLLYFVVQLAYAVRLIQWDFYQWSFIALYVVFTGLVTTVFFLDQ